MSIDLIVFKSLLFEFVGGCSACFSTDAFGYCVEDLWAFVRCVPAFGLIVLVETPFDRGSNSGLIPSPMI